MHIGSRHSQMKMSNFVCYTENQREDLKFFLSQKSSYPIGVDRTFNLGKFFVTALVYKILRVVRNDNASEHPPFIGPVFIHRDSTVQAYNYFFSTIKASLCSDSINSFELKLNCDVLIGSDEEKALTKAIGSVFPAANRFLCTKHLKDGTRAYLQKEVGVPQKDRNEICQAIFGEKGLINADDSISFDKRSKDILVKASKYPKFSKYFNRKLKPYVQLYVNQPSRAAKISDWTNNNCESLNSMVKRDANWKVKSTPELIDMLHEVTLLHFKDFRRALYE